MGFCFGSDEANRLRVESKRSEMLKEQERFLERAAQIAVSLRQSGKEFADALLDALDVAGFEPMGDFTARVLDDAIDLGHTPDRYFQLQQFHAAVTGAVAGVGQAQPIVEEEEE